MLQYETCYRESLSRKVLDSKQKIACLPKNSVALSSLVLSVTRIDVLHISHNALWLEANIWVLQVNY